MKKIISSCLIFLNLLFAQNIPTTCSIVFDNNFSITDIPAAFTPERKAKGLSNKKDIGSGMVFVWERPEKVSFWMKNTYVPLSIGFFDSNGILFQINDMSPHSLELHHSVKSTFLALELSQGDFEKFNIKIGSKITEFICK